jgi:hypothetical protein
MQLNLPSGIEFYLDELVLECILKSLTAKQLSCISLVCKSLYDTAQHAATSAVFQVVERVESVLVPRFVRGSWIHELRDWELLEANNLVWYQADPERAIVVRDEIEEELRVQRIADLSGNGHFAAASQERMPIMRKNGLNGHPVIEFDGRSSLQTRPLDESLPQPVTLILVAMAMGDTTMVDSLGSQ